MEQLEWIKYPCMFPYGTFNSIGEDPTSLQDPFGPQQTVYQILFNLNYGNLIVPYHSYDPEYYTFKYRCMSCAEGNIDWYTEEFTRDRYVLESVEKQMEEHVRNHTTFGAWGISVYRNMKEKK